MSRKKLIEKSDIKYQRAMEIGKNVVLFVTEDEINSLRSYEVPPMMQTTGQPVSNQKDFDTGFRLGWNSAILELLRRGENRLNAEAVYVSEE